MAIRTKETVQGEIRENESRIESVQKHIVSLEQGKGFHSPLFGSTDSELAYARTTLNNLLAKRGGLDRDLVRVGMKAEPTEEQKKQRELAKAQRAMDRALKVAAEAEVRIQQLSAPAQKAA